MKISIITVCYNSQKTIKDTIESVLNQTYDNYEYILIDGKSSDDTVKIIESYKKKFKGKMKYISEKDKGLFDAMNKGIKMSTGDIIGIINSDDTLAKNDVFEIIASKFKDKSLDGIYSNIYFLDENMKKINRVFKAKKGNYKLGWYPPHPSLYLKSSVYKKYGNYNNNFRISADYDFMLRIMKNNVKLGYIDDVLVYMRSGGVSTAGIKGYKKSFDESIKVLKNNGIKFPYFVNSLRTIKILFQGIKGSFSREVK